MRKALLLTWCGILAVVETAMRLARAALRVVPDRARVEHQHRGVFRALRQREAGRDRAALYVLRIGLVHLAAVGLDVDLRHAVF